MGGFKSGFVSILGRPNVGKSTLVNSIIGEKVTIVSDKPNTTRGQIRGIMTSNRGQVVFVDTPGIHKPKSLMGQRLNDAAVQSIGDVDLVIVVIDGTAKVGKGDDFVLAKAPRDALVVLNKIDLASREMILSQLSLLSKYDKSSYFPISAKSGEGIPVLLDEIFNKLPEGPMFYPPQALSDISDAEWVAELVREQLLGFTREELPHSIACLVTEWEWPRVRCEIHVERSSQKAIVIGKGGSILKQVGSEVRKQLPLGAFLELFVKVTPNWQSRPQSLERLGY